MITVPKRFRELGSMPAEITAGGHKCVIKQVKENDGVVDVMFDTSLEDTQPEIFLAAWKADTRAEKRWRGIRKIFIDNEYAQKNIARFCTAVEDSNAGYKFTEGTPINFDELKGKRVGVVFQEQESKNNPGVFYTNPVRFCGYFEAFEQEVPKRKGLDATPSADKAAAQEGFKNIADDIEGLPFN